MSDLEVISPVHFDSPYRSDGLVEHPSGNLLVAKGYAVYQVTPDWQCSVWAGSVDGFENGPRLKAKFRLVCGMVLVEQRRLFLACQIEYRIRLVESDMVTTYAGNGKLGSVDGPRLSASFSFPDRLAHHCGKLYISTYDNRLRVIDLETGMVTSLCGLEANGKELLDGPISSARILGPNALLSLPTDSLIFGDSHTIRKLDLRAQTITTVVGNLERGFCDADKGKDARFAYPSCLIALPDGDWLLADAGNNALRRIAPMNKYKTTTLVGSENRNGFADGPLPHATLNNPSALLLTTKGDLVWTEVQGLRVIKNFGKLFAIFSFWDALQPSETRNSDVLDSLADLSFVHLKSQRTIRLHSSALKRSENDVDLRLGLQRVQALNYSFKMYNAFFALVYGSNDIFSATEAKNTDKEATSKRLRKLIALADAFPMPSLRVWLKKNLEDLEEKSHEGKDSDMETLEPASLMRKHLGDLLRFEVKIRNLCEAFDGRPMFSLGVLDEYGKQKWYEVHDWLMYCKWTYFRRMLDAGLEEAISRRASLPQDFSEPLLIAVLDVIYKCECDTNALTTEECKFALDNAEEFGFKNLDGSAATGFSNFLYSCEATIMAKLRH